MLDELAAMYDHLPEDERLRAAFDDILSGIDAGFLAAILEPDGTVRYKHVNHCTDAELKQQLTSQQVRISQKTFLTDTDEN